MCFNRLVQTINLPFTYHRPPLHGLSSAQEDTNALAYIIFGSASNVEERLDWHKSLSDFCYERLKENKPVLGLCFGHQLMADYFGMEVTKNPQQMSLYGTRSIIFEENFGLIKKGHESNVFIAHSYQVVGPLKELKVLASSIDCPYDGLYHPSMPYWGFQGHPEGSLDFYQHEILDHTSPLEDDLLKNSLNNGLDIIRQFSQVAQKLVRSL